MHICRGAFLYTCAPGKFFFEWNPYEYLVHILSTCVKGCEILYNLKQKCLTVVILKDDNTVLPLTETYPCSPVGSYGE